ncbi:CHAT domain-containing protein [Aliinostoc sp. HNIBRCY26]|uniref:CHAT domain-containing protein n=1 Tax=Aliinostoc sp. HNIBRCY26 TaxID=3418997 RepID=UPI003CFDCD8D
MIYRWRSFTILSLVLYLTFGFAGWELKPLLASQVSAQNQDTRNIEADKLLQQSEQLSENHQPQAALKTVQQALSIYRKVKDKQGEGKALNYLGNIYSDGLDEYNQSINYYQQALKIARQNNDSSLEVRALSNLGLTKFQLGNPQSAIEDCEQALALARKNQHYETEALALKCLGAIYIINDTSKGLDFIEQSLMVLEKASGSPDDQLRQDKLKTSILTSLGNLYYGLGVGKLYNKDPTGEQLLTKSLEDYQQALKIAQKIGDRPKQAKVLLGIGDIYQFQSQYSKSEATFQEALQILQSNQNWQSQSREVHSKLGDLYTRWSKQEQALKSYQETLKIITTERFYSPLQKLRLNIDQGWILANIGNIYAYTNRYEKALETYQQAFTILQTARNDSQKIINPQKQISEIRIIRGMQMINIQRCTVYTFIGQDEKAKRFCQAASNISENNISPTKSHKSPSEIAKSRQKLNNALKKLEQAQILGSPDLIAFALAQAGEAYSNLEEYKLAEEYLQKALALIQTTDTLQFKPYIFIAAGVFYEQQKQYDVALKYYQQSGEFAKQSGDKLQEANVLRQIATTNLTINKLPQATTALYRAIDIFESIRNNLSDPNQISIFETQIFVYNLLQKTLIRQNKFQEALAVAERSRARAFINLLTSRVTTQNKLTINLDDLNILPPAITDIQKIAQEQKATIVQYTVPDSGIQKNQDQNQQLNITEIYIWVIKPNGEISFKQVNLNVLNISLEDLVNEGRLSIGSGGRNIRIERKSVPNSQATLQKLHEILITPIASYLPTIPEEKVIFIPHNSLFLVSFAALQDKNGKYLIEKHTILTAPAIQVLDLTRHQRQKVTGKNVLVMGNPIMPKVGNPPIQLEPLPGAQREALNIANLFNVKAITGKDATTAALKQRLSTARIIHLATHGLLDDPSQNIPTAIALAPTNNDDGLLTPKEILDLKINAELVVLSACDTGRGKITGDGVIGLSRALITAGASSVIVSLWAVPDAPTSELMTEFYQQWEKNSDKAVALRNAMLITMKKHPSPIDWAAFTLIGES